ncbi:hypothetical protein [Fontivita pretiosa]|uniref:hypothetical protein n=1 Tax=Fontivita pretiosa TaxID=2989684 RepID=UPI003D176C78
MSQNPASLLPPAYPNPQIGFVGFNADPNATVQTDAPCRKCGYNLRGLTYGGRCPECGSPVGLSTIGDLLRYSDPNWLLMLARGVSFILWGILVALVIGLLGGLLFQTSAAQQWVQIVASLLGLYGAWLLTEPDPSGLGEAQYAMARKLVRVALLVGLGGSVLQAMGATPGVPREIGFGLGVVAIGATVFGVVGEFAKFVYLGKLALRVPHDQLARRARVLCWGYGLTLGASVLIGGIMGLLLAAGPAPARPGAAFIGITCAAAIVGLAYLVFGVMTLLFYIRMRRTLREQVELARQVWGQATAAAADQQTPATA